MRKVNMPAWIFPMSPVGMSAVNLSLSLVPFLILYFAAGNVPRWEWLLVPFIILMLMAFLLGLSLVLSVLNVFYRDVGHVLEPVLQLAFYGTPIIYDRQNAAFPPWVKSLLALNPFTHFVEVFRAALIPQGELKASQLLICLASSLLALAAGTIIYRRARNNLLLEL